VTELLAVYGTLMSGQDYEGRPPVEEMMRSRGPCRIPGRLYTDEHGAYPWLQPGEGVVLGELFEVLEPETAFPVLDDYEDEDRHADHGEGTYARVKLHLLEPDVEAWVYVWDGAARGEPLDDGDWRTFLALRGDR
jgi:gamma-glutamylcyclotransferase (GGCT)/AIG2-like uncharacterized protein YtfP